MEEIYVTLAEAAELEDIQYNTMVVRIKRNEEALIVKTKKSETGGRDKVFIALSSLSKQARVAYKERKRLKELPEEELDLSQAPWYVTSDPDWYMANYKANYYKGIEMRSIVQKFLKEAPQGKTRTEFTEEFAREHIHKNGRTFYRHVKSYYEAGAWASQMERLDGQSYDWFTILALCRKPKEKGKFPSFSDDVKRTVSYIWFNKEFAANRGTVGMLYERLMEVAEMNGWERIPSYQSVCRYITWLMEDERMKNAHTLAADGLREYRNRVMVKGRRDIKSLKVMEVVMGDEHTFDCWVSYTNENGKTVPIRPKLVAWIDVRSRSIMGDVICKDPNSRVLKESLLRMLYQEHGGVPEYLFIDNGKDYTSRVMTGRPRNVRSGDPAAVEEFHGNELAFEDEAIGFYRAIGIKDDHRALPYQPWDKGQVERFFGTVCSQFTKWMASYTGTLTGSRTSDKVSKDIKDMFEKGQLLTMDEFCTAWRNWLEKYHHKQHRELKKAQEQWLTPWELFENGERYEKALPPKSRATMLMLQSDGVLVRNTGISRWGYDYRAQELCDYINEKVLIKYDPNDVSVLYVFDPRSKKQICEAVSQELLSFGPGIKEKTLEAHKRMQKLQEKRDKERLAKTQDLGELAERAKGFNPVTGGIDLMIKGEGRTAKVISLPNDPAYRNNPEMRKRKSRENSYMARNAKKALEQMAALEG